MAEFTPDSHYPIEVERLPATWLVVPVGKAIQDIKNGFSSGEHNEIGDGIPHLRPMNVDRGGRIALTTLKYVRPDVNLRIGRGDVLFNNTNSAELVGKTAAFDRDGEWSFSNHMTRLRPPLGILPEFVAYQFLFLWQEGYFQFRSTQHVNQASISARTLAESIPLVVAPTVDQVAIVAELNRTFQKLQKAEAATNRATRSIEEYKRKLVIEAAAGALVPNEFVLAQFEHRPFEAGTALLERIENQSGDPGAIGIKILDLFNGNPPKRRKAKPEKPVEERKLSLLPEGWIWTRVDQVGDVTLGRKREPKHHHGQHMRPYLRVANVFEDRIDVSSVLEMNFSPEEYQTYSLRRGDILLCEGQSPELVGRPAMYRDEVPGACFQMTLIRFRAYAGVSPTFALLVFRAYLHLGRFQQAARWSTNIAHLSTGRFAEMEFPLPPLAEQERIVQEAERRLQSADDLASTLNLISERISVVRHAALARAFVGALVPAATDAEPAASLLHSPELPGVGDRLDPKAKLDSPTMPKRPTSRRRSRRAITDVLTEAGEEMRPENLFDASGIGEDLIDEFFAELKQALAAGWIVERRDSDGNPLIALGRSAV